jgi:intracellular sulfur oxidation DsrE/DsrF family protein
MANHDTVILVGGPGMGRGPESLQQTLLGKYLDLLNQQGDLPYAICFYNGGVELVVEDSPVLEQLRALEARGVRLIICSTCIEFFGFQKMVKVGIVGGMGDILEAQLRAGKIITL